ncbi:MAG TPA: Ku protein, partial [Capsulimonadaceae bacterium]|nr:Ku protein [Capsulimonadaceae bacterium]
FDKPYYIQPDKKAGKAYALLYEALKETGKVGLAKVTLRTKERLAAVQAGDRSLMLYTMHFADEIREIEAKPDIGDVSPKELKMAETLIDSMSGHFEPNKYEDDYGKALMNLISEKMNGLPHKKAQAKVEATEVMDLMEYLKASIEKNAGKNGSRRTKAPVIEKAEKPKRRARTAAA